MAMSVLLLSTCTNLAAEWLKILVTLICEVNSSAENTLIASVVSIAGYTGTLDNPFYILPCTLISGDDGFFLGV